MAARDNAYGGGGSSTVLDGQSRKTSTPKPVRARVTRKKTSLPARRATPARRSSSSSRSSGGGGGGGRGRDSSGRLQSGRSAANSGRGPAAGTPNIASYLAGDSVYQGSVSGGKRSLADFLSELGRRRGEANTQFTTTQASMERDRVQQLEDLRNEFASRGLIQSGLYSEEQGRFQQQFTDQANALKQQQAALLADLLSQEKNYRREQDMALQVAKQEALARRAAKYNIGG